MKEKMAAFRAKKEAYYRESGPPKVEDKEEEQE